MSDKNHSKPLKKLVRPAYDKFLNICYASRLQKIKIQKSRLLILGTIARSGTHYTKFLLANYINLAGGSIKGPISPKEMNMMFPNTWDRVYLNRKNKPFGSIDPIEYKKPSNDIKILGLQDMARSHSSYQIPFWTKSPVLHLYRNPLDYAVSIYYYMHKNRFGAVNVSGPMEALNNRFDDYVKMYHSYKNAAKSGKVKILRISYEDLKLYPEMCLRIILKWLGNEPKESIIKDAVNFASIDEVKKMEKKGDRINPTAINLKKTFIHHGGIGQWKKYFNKNKLANVRQKFLQVGINLDDFTLEI